MNEQPAAAMVRGALGPQALPHRSIPAQAGKVLAGSTPLTLTNDMQTMRWFEPSGAVDTDTEGRDAQHNLLVLLPRLPMRRGEPRCHRGLNETPRR